MKSQPVYLTASEEQIIEAISNALDKLLEPYYLRFCKFLIGGLALVVGGVIALVWSPNYLILSIALLVVPGIILILYALMKKIHIEEAGVVIYPILAVPYGDLSKSVLVDVPAKCGEDVSFKISRIDMIRSEVDKYLQTIRSLRDFYVDPDVATSIPAFLKISRERGVEMTFEEETVKQLGELSRLLLERPYDEFSFKLFRSSGTLTLHPSDISMWHNVLGSRLFEMLDNYIDRVGMLIESLKVQYRDLMNLVLEVLDNFTGIIIKHYGEIKGYIARLKHLVRYLAEEPKARLCPRCVAIHKDRILRSTFIPVLLKGVMHRVGDDIEVEYKCPECGSAFYEHVYFSTAERMPLIRYEHDILKLVTWNSIYLSEIDKISEYMREARKSKAEILSEALRHIDNLNEQFKTRILPTFIELYKVYGEIIANRDLTSWAQDVNLSLPSSCYALSGVSLDLSTIESLKDVIAGKHTHLLQISRELEGHSKLRTNILFDELFINILVEALEKMNRADEAGRVKSAYEEKAFEELEALVLGVHQEAAK